MKKSFLNKLMMIKAVLSYLGLHNLVWNTVPDIVSDVDALQALSDEIDVTRQEAGNDLTGLTDHKEAEKKKLNGMTFTLAAALAAMAERTGNEALLSNVDFSRSELEDQRDEDQELTARNIAALARENLAALSTGGTTEADITALEAQTDVFREYLPVHRVSVAERKAANEKLNELFKESNRLLKMRLDKMMVRYELSDPDFYAGYVNARIIVDYGVRHETT
jgi:hypothetical protein